MCLIEINIYTYKYKFKNWSWDSLRINCKVVQVRGSQPSRKIIQTMNEGSYEEVFGCGRSVSIEYFPGQNFHLLALVERHEFCLVRSASQHGFANVARRNFSFLFFFSRFGSNDFQAFLGLCDKIWAWVVETKFAGSQDHRTDTILAE